MIVQEPVQAAIWHCLNHYAYGDAIFLAERLCAEVETEETLYLLATCYYRSGRPGQAYSVLRGKGTRCSQSRFLLAKCCQELGRLAEAEALLSGQACAEAGGGGAGGGGGGAGGTGGADGTGGLDAMIADFGDSACFAMQLLARICCQTERLQRAAEAYRRALKLNPFLWTSFEALCSLGEKPDPTRIFQVAHLDSFSMCHGTNTLVNLVNSQPSEPHLLSTGPHNTSHNISDPLVGSVVYSTPVTNLCGMSIPLPVTVGKNLHGGAEDSSIVPVNGPQAPPVGGVSGLPPRPGRPCPSSSAPSKPIKYVSLFNAPQPPSPLTPSFGVLPLDSSCSGESPLTFAFLSPPIYSRQPLSADTAEQKGLSKRNKSVFSQSCNTSNAVNIVSTPASQPPSAPAPLQPGLNVRRSSRLFSSNNSVKENNKGPSRSKIAAPNKSPSRKSKARVTRSQQASFHHELNEKNRAEAVAGGGGLPPTTTPANSLPPTSTPAPPPPPCLGRQALSLQKYSAEGLMALLRDLGTAQYHLSQLDCRRALQCLGSLPSRQARTGWVLGQLGRAHLELGEYEAAARHFARLREREPYRTHLMEHYSTTLWHLQREVALSALAQDLLAHDRNSPSAWCAAGNCFSLQKEHEAAIRFFQRAVQVDPNFAYAYTLLGHEYVTNEELDKAMSCFRSAVRIDPRHYNAWYGVGMIYYKQEKFQLAEIYFRKALNINPQSSILMCHMGVVHQALYKTERALQILNLAISNDPHNPLCKFHRASIYFAVERYQEALKELEELKEIVPKESLVYFLMGKVHNKLGNTHLALMHFSCAMDLDPKGANSHIKEAIDPAINRPQAEDNEIFAASNGEAGEEFASEGSSLPAQESSSQESLDFHQLQALDSDESL